MTCPTPRKRPYTSLDDVRKSLTASQARVGATPDHYYRCECGYWHVAGSDSLVRDTLRKRNHRTKGGAKRYRRSHQRRGCL